MLINLISISCLVTSKSKILWCLCSSPSVGLFHLFVVHFHLSPPLFNRQETWPRRRYEVYPQDVRAAGRHPQQPGDVEDSVPPLHLCHGHQQHPQGLQRREGHRAAQVSKGLWDHLNFYQAMKARRKDGSCLFVDILLVWVKAKMGFLFST